MQIQNQVCLTVKIMVFFFFLDKLSIKVMLFQIKKKNLCVHLLFKVGAWNPVWKSQVGQED